MNMLGLEKKLFVSCNGPKKNRVGRSKKSYYFLSFFCSAMCVLCMLLMIGSREGLKNLRVGIFLSKNLLG